MKKLNKTVTISGMMAVSKDKCGQDYVQFLPDEPQAGLVTPFAGAGYGQLLCNGSMDFIKRKSRPRKKPLFKADYASLSFGSNDHDYIYIKVPNYLRADLPQLLRKDISKIAAYLKKEGWSK